MSDGPEWFAAKSHGYGAGLPISWQGWLLTIGFTILAGGVAYRFADKPLVILSILIPATLLLTLIASKTTRGGWRWRWGKKD